MKKEALLHIPLSKDAFMVDSSTMIIRLRTAKDDAKDCEIFFGDRVCMQEPIEVTGIEMEKIACDEYFDYYEAKIKSPYTRVCYYFKIIGKDREMVFYSEYGITGEINCHRTQYFQFPYLHREDVICQPEWTKNMIMYHIFPDSFASGKRSISKEKKEISLENNLQSVSYQGGTIEGIIDNLDYIKGLHANCIYLNPIFKAKSYHKYDTIDYFEIDPCFGTKKDLIELVKKCHEKDMHVILDGVFNHCGDGFFAFQDVLKKQEASAYKDWFYHLEFPVKNFSPINYEAFAYVPEMPKLDTANKEVQEYFCNVGRYWIREAGIDGWRLDVANEINHDFWRAFRRAVREEKKDCFLIGEIWENADIWLQGDQFDSTMNYTFSYICKEFFAQQSIRAKEFGYKINQMILRYPEQVTLMQMNFLDTHDVPRFLSYCKGDIKRLRLAVFFMMTAQGIPSVFYGDEKGIEGTTEPEYRKPMLWDIQHELEKSYQEYAKLRREHTALQSGSFRVLQADDEKNLFIFERVDSSERVNIIINNSETESDYTLSDKIERKIGPFCGEILFY